LRFSPCITGEFMESSWDERNRLFKGARGQA
jgi:hypothetical protein